MKWNDLLLLSLQNLWRRKLRTILTVVGVMIGTTSIVIMVSIGIGANKEFEDSIMSSETLTRIEVNDPAAWDRQASSKAKVRLDDQFLSKAQKMDHVDFVSPVMQVYPNNASMQIRTRKYVAGTSITGLSLEAFERIVPFAEGAGPEGGGSLKPIQLVMGTENKTDFRKENSNSWTGIAPNIDWLNTKYTMEFVTWNEDGQQEIAKKYDVDLVGISGNEGGRSWSGYEWGFFTDINTLKRLVKENPKMFGDVRTDQYDRAYIQVDNYKYVTQVLDDLKEGNNLQFYAEMEWIEANRQQGRSLQLMLGGIGGIVMLVAAISIANTMLMSIYERTREIGVMKVLGCRLSNISFLFLGEAGFIGLFGGVIGVGFSYGLSALLNFVIAYYSRGSGMSYIPPWLAIASLVFAVGVGILSGLYPSQRAMKLSALAAIRNDV